MDNAVARRHGETETHLRLKRLAALWAQANGFTICATEVSLPRCRYRADVAAYRPQPNDIGLTAIFECKQSLGDLRKDSCDSARTRERLATMLQRRVVLEKHLRIHYPTLRCGDSLFPEFESHRFDAIEHRGYKRLVLEMRALQQQLYSGTKFETLVRYRCANLFFLVLPNELQECCTAPETWGVLVQSGGTLIAKRKPTLHEIEGASRQRFLERLAAVATRFSNRQLDIAFEEVCDARRSSV